MIEVTRRNFLVGAPAVALLPSRAIYAHDGEVVTCDRNDHPICVVGRDIYVDDSYHLGDLTGWMQVEPRKGEPVPRCVRCGGQWVYLMPGPALHFYDGWRIGGVEWPYRS